jgi:hypothetical protein
MRIATASVTILLIASIATPATAAPKRPTPLVVPFSATAAFGETVNILTHGTITLRLQCDPGLSVGDVARLTVISTEDDMLLTGAPSVLIPANDANTLIYGSIVANDGAGYVGANPTATNFYDGGPSGGSAITPSGFVLTVPADSVGFGIGTSRFSAVPHAWEQAPDCFVVGTALLLKAAPLTQ